MKRFFIGSNGSNYWTECNAKTLRGAKTIASKTYQQSVGGRIEVGEEVTHPNGEKEIVTAAIKNGYENWINC